MGAGDVEMEGEEEISTEEVRKIIRRIKEGKAMRETKYPRKHGIRDGRKH